MEELNYIQNRLLEVLSEIDEFENTEAIGSLAMQTIERNLKSAVYIIDLARYALEGRK